MVYDFFCAQLDQVSYSSSIVELKLVHLIEVATASSSVDLTSKFGVSLPSYRQDQDVSMTVEFWTLQSFPVTQASGRIGKEKLQ